MTDKKIQSVLVFVGGDLIGDALMKLPFVRALRHAFPDARITWCAGKHKSAFAHQLAPLVGGLIDEVIEEAGFERALPLLIARPLDGRRFDIVIDTQRGVPVTVLVRRIRHDIFISGSANFLLSDRKPKKPYTRPASMVGQMLDLLELATGRPPDTGAPLLLEASLRDQAARALPDGAVYIGLAPGAGGRQKCWPLTRFIQLARNQQTLGRIPVFILGPGEAEWAATLRDAVPDALFPTVDGDGKVTPTIGFSIALGQRLTVAIANDSGVGHILAAADTPLISLFGPTPAVKFAPTANRLVLIEAQNFGSDAMDAIPLEAVTDAIEQLADNV
jgi:ADP-heptose:LPS heptosyltransferase